MFWTGAVTILRNRKINTDSLLGGKQHFSGRIRFKNGQQNCTYISKSIFFLQKSLQAVHIWRDLAERAGISGGISAWPFGIKGGKLRLSMQIPET